MFKPQLEKCPFCSGNRSKSWLKTLRMYPETNSYFCFHCNAYGSLDSLDVNVVLEKKKTYVKPRFIGVTSRVSMVRPSGKNRYGNDIFGIKAPNGEITGYHERRIPKQSITEGKRLFGYSSDFLDFSETYRVVEGPYDCIYPNDVCVFGLPGKEQSKLLKPYKLILCPDGDIWTSEEKVLQWFRPFLYNKIQYVERLPDDKDPDEVPEKERRKLVWKTLKNWIFQK